MLCVSLLWFVGCLMFAVKRCALSAVRFVLFVVGCSLCVAGCCLMCCLLLFAACCLLAVDCACLLVVACVLVVVWSAMSVFLYWWWLRRLLCLVCGWLCALFVDGC